MSERSRLICFEGCDGTGKTTQTKLLAQRLTETGKTVRTLKFPDYGSLSSGPVRMYLNGELGSDPESVNSYAASVLYAADRLCSYKKDWERDYRAGTVIVTDRYVTSNFIFQAAKLPPEKQLDFVRWNQELEYAKMGLPTPDVVIYLDLPPEVSERRVRDRSAETGQQIDIHEKDAAYQHAVAECGRMLAGALGWRLINCAPEGRLLSREEIAAIIWSEVGQTI